MNSVASQQSIFESGSDLWIIPDRKNSKLAQKLDWYLNFQILKSVQHRTVPLPAPVHDILNSCHLKGYDWAPEESDSLLILSSHIFPNRWVLQIQGSDQLESWIQSAVEKWKGLNRPSVRIFLPQSVSIAQFERMWRKAGGSEDAIFIADQMDLNHG